MSKSELPPMMSANTDAEFLRVARELGERGRVMTLEEARNDPGGDGTMYIGIGGGKVARLSDYDQGFIFGRMYERIRQGKG